MMKETRRKEERKAYKQITTYKAIKYNFIIKLITNNNKTNQLTKIIKQNDKTKTKKVIFLYVMDTKATRHSNED